MPSIEIAPLRFLSPLPQNRGWTTQARPPRLGPSSIDPVLARAMWKPLRGSGPPEGAGVESTFPFPTHDSLWPPRGPGIPGGWAFDRSTHARTPQRKAGNRSAAVAVLDRFRDSPPERLTDPVSINHLTHPPSSSPPRGFPDRRSRLTPRRETMGNTPGSKPQVAGTANATRSSASGYVFRILGLGHRPWPAFWG